MHKGTLAREVLKDYRPADGDWPSEHFPERRAEARAQFAELLEHVAAEY